MKNLDNIKHLSDAEFLSFLYSEQNRCKEKDARGWTPWALLGSIFALAVYAYYLLKPCNGQIDFRLCYYIICAFLPIVLYFVHAYEQYEGFDYGDSKHIARLKDAAPIGILAFLGISLLVLAIISFCIKDWVLAIMNLIAAFPSIVSVIMIVVQKDRFVTTVHRFAHSSTPWLNIVLTCLVPLVLLEPFSTALGHLGFEFTNEFELCIVIIVIIVLAYLFMRTAFHTTTEKSIGAIIEAYLYKDLCKEDALKQLEELILGKRPSDALKMYYDRLANYEVTIPELSNRFDEIESDIKGKCLGKTDLEKLLNEVSCNINYIAGYLKLYENIVAKSKELLSLKTLVSDEDFLAMLDILLDTETLQKNASAASNLQKRMSACLKTASEKCQSSLCLNTNCSCRT